MPLVSIMPWSTDDYSAIVKALAPASLVAYLPLWEPSGASALDQSGHGYNGAHTAVTLNQPGIGDGRTAASYDGSTSFTNWYSAGLAGAFTGQEVTVACWVKMTAGVLADGVLRRAVILMSDSNNRVIISKSNQNTNVVAEYRAAGVIKSVPFQVASTGWMHLCMTASRSADQFKLYVDGIQVSQTQTGLGTFAGVLSTINAAIGSGQTAPIAGPFQGLIQHVAVWSTPLSALQVQSLAYHNAWPARPVFFGDSVTFGTGATAAANQWVNLVAASRGWGDHVFNEGISVTTLQNTVQNAQAPAGQPTTNNGRDTVVGRVTSHAPSDVVILYGLNDLRLNDVAFTSALYQNDLGEVIDAIVASGTPAQKIVIGSPSYIPAASYPLLAPYNGGSAVKHAAYVTAAQAVATAKSTKYIDVYGWMAANGGDTLISADGIHPNNAGHLAIANAFLSVL